MIELNEIEMRIAQFLQKKRTELAAQHNCTERMVSKDVEGSDLQGVYGEMAYGKLMNMYMSLSLDYCHYDYMDFLGNKIDVKSAKPEYNLIVPEHQGDHDVDIYALMLGQDDRWEYAGWTHKADIINDDHWRTDMPQPCWFMRVDDPMFRRNE